MFTAGSGGTPFAVARETLQSAKPSFRWHSLNLRVVAKGIEHPWQYDFLKQHDCDEAQGFLIGRPVMADEIQIVPNGDGNVPDLLEARARRHRSQQQVQPPPI